MMDKYQKLRHALSQNPTPGPWVQDGDGVSAYDEDVAVAVSCPSDAEAAFIAACDPGTIRALLGERDGLTAENARLREALHVVSECGDPCKVILYDEEGIEGWRWTHPDGREWTEMGEWSKGPPLHPVARAALAALQREQWVPVSERLPEKEQYPVLVAHQSGAVRMVFGIKPFIDGDWMGYYAPALQGRFLRGITHWMPLPPAPQPEEAP